MRIIEYILIQNHLNVTMIHHKYDINYLLLRYHPTGFQVKKKRMMTTYVRHQIASTYYLTL